MSERERAQALQVEDSRGFTFSRRCHLKARNPEVTAQLCCNPSSISDVLETGCHL